MQAEFSTVTSKGQLVIPARLRRKLGIRKGTRVSFLLEDNNRIVLQPVNGRFIRSLRGCLKGSPSGLDLLLKAHQWEREHEERKWKPKR